MVKRHTIPPRSPQAEGDAGAGGEAQSPSEPGTGDATLEEKQKKERSKTFGREQGGNQQGNQRGIGNPGDR
jgi:hypothetical protein